MPATTVLPSAIKAASARAMRIISWPNTDPAHSLSTLSPDRYRSEPKTRYEASGAELPRWRFHPLEIMSSSCRTQISSTSSSSTQSGSAVSDADEGVLALRTVASPNLAARDRRRTLAAVEGRMSRLAGRQL